MLEESAVEYLLLEEDLSRVFGRYGVARRIRVDEHGSGAEITYHSFE